MLRVGVIGPTYPDSFAENICSGFRQLGCHVVPLGSARPGAHRSQLMSALAEVATRSVLLDERVQRRVLLPAVRRERLDLIVNVEQFLLPALVLELKGFASRVVTWFPDHVGGLGRQFVLRAPYDAVFVKEPVLVRQARDLLGLDVHYLPEACNPEWHRPPDGVQVGPHLAVLGSTYPYRVRLLERLVDAGVPLVLYGPPIPRWVASPSLEARHSGRYIGREEKAHAFRGAAAVLNLHHPAEIEGVNCRLFEAAGCGGAVLTDHRKELPDFFEPGLEVEVFSSFDELVDLARRALAEPGWARGLGDRAASRAHAQHTYAHRLRVMLSALGLEEALDG